MRKQMALALWLMLVFSTIVGTAYATDGSLADQFLGGPLLILVAVLVVDSIALAYHRIRK